MAESLSKRHKILLWAGWSGVVCLGIGIVVAAIWPAAVLLGTRDVHNVAPAIRGVQTRLAIEAVRGQFIQLGGGLLAFGAFWYTIRNFALARKQTELNRQTLELGEQGQVTDRYAKAIEQLGSESIDVRIGGIYALERLTVDSGRDHATIMEVLAAFVRRSARREAPAEPGDELEVSQPAGEISLAADAAAAMTVIARRDIEKDVQIIDLHGVDLAGIRIIEARLQSVDLSFARLRNAELPAARLAHTLLVQADLAHAQLPGADLSHAQLGKADLTGVVLTKATLTHAQLPGAVLNKAQLDGVTAFRGNFSGASLQGADLSDAILVSGDFTGAVMTGAHFTRADLANAELAGSNLLDANFTDADMSGVSLTAQRMVDVNLAGVRVSQDASIPSGWRRGEDGRLQRDTVQHRPKLPT